MRRLCALALAFLAACQASSPERAAFASYAPPDIPLPGPIGEAQTYSGRFRFGFEQSSFDGCWLALGAHGSDFEAPDRRTGAAALYEISFIGRRTDMIVPPGQELRGGFGHLRLSRCKYDIEQLLSSRRIE